MKKRCRDCVHWTLYGCTVMIVPFRDMSCFSTLEQQIETEKAIAAYPHTSHTGKIAGNKKVKELEKELERRKKE